jgi:hypothetical protein
MADEPEAPEAKPEDETVPAERFREMKKHHKAADERAKALEQQLTELKAQIEDRDAQGLPELERERKRAEALEKRAADA